MTTRTTGRRTLALALVGAFLAGALARDVLVSRAAAGDASALTREDVHSIVRALEAQADATKDVARHVERMGRR